VYLFRCKSPILAPQIETNRTTAVSEPYALIAEPQRATLFPVRFESLLTDEDLEFDVCEDHSLAQVFFQAIIRERAEEEG
jgi:hypothetical protein